jgi:hypothetical protein
MLYNFYIRNLQMFAEVFVLAKLFQPCLMFVGKARRLRAYPRVEHLKVPSLR